MLTQILLSLLLHLHITHSFPLPGSTSTANLSPTTDYTPSLQIASIALSQISQNTYVLRSHTTNLYLGYNTTSTSIDAWPGTEDTWGWMVGQANWDDSDGTVGGISTVIGSNKKRSLASGSPVYCLTGHEEDDQLTGVMNTCDAPSILKARELWFFVPATSSDCPSSAMTNIPLGMKTCLGLFSLVICDHLLDQAPHALDASNPAREVKVTTPRMSMVDWSRDDPNLLWEVWSP